MSERVLRGAAGAAEPGAEGAAAHRRRLLGAARRAGDRAAAARDVRRPGRRARRALGRARAVGQRARRRRRWRRPGTRRGSSGSAACWPPRRAARASTSLLAPTVNLHRTPYGGRHFECFSEDPLLTGRIGAAYVRGLQAEGVAATVKHFVANDSETERFTLDARVDERALRELYLAPFEAIVRDAGAVGGDGRLQRASTAPTMTESPLLQRRSCTDEWGWDGLVMSDWTAARTHRGAPATPRSTSPCPARTARGATRSSTPCATGASSEAAIDDKVLRLLRLAARVGALDGVDAAAPPPRPWTTTRWRPSCARPPRPASCSPATTALLPLRRRPRGSPCSARTRRSRARSAAAARRSSRPTRSRRSRACARRCRRSRSRTRPACAPTRGSPRPRRSCCRRRRGALPRRRRRRVLGAEHRDGAALHVARLAARPATARDRAARRRCAPPRPGEHVVGVSGVGPLPALARRRRGCSTSALELPPGRRPRRGASCAPPQHGVPVHARSGEHASVVLRYELEPDALMAAVQLNVEPPFGDEDAELERAVALAPRGRRRGRRGRHHRGGRVRGLRPRRRSRCPAARTSWSRRVARGQPAHRRGRQRGRARAAARGPTRSPRSCSPGSPARSSATRSPTSSLGAVEPGGRLPTTWPATEEGLPVDPAAGRRPRLRRGPRRRLPRLRARRPRAAVPVRPRPRLHELGVPGASSRPTRT